MMKTVNKVREEFAENFKQHIVTIDHNVPSNFDQEFSFHVVCHPEIDQEGEPQMPSDISSFLDEIADEYECGINGMHIHTYIKVSNDILGIDEGQNIKKVKEDTVE